MASKDNQPKTRTQNTGAEAAKELEQSSDVTDVVVTTEDEPVRKRRKLEVDVTQAIDDTEHREANPSQDKDRIEGQPESDNDTDTDSDANLHPDEHNTKLVMVDISSMMPQEGYGSAFTVEDNVYVSTSYSLTEHFNHIDFQIILRDGTKQTVTSSENICVVKCKAKDICIYYIPKLFMRSLPRGPSIVHIKSGKITHRKSGVLMDGNTILTSTEVSDSSPCEIIFSDCSKTSDVKVNRDESGCSHILLKQACSDYTVEQWKQEMSGDIVSVLNEDCYNRAKHSSFKLFKDFELDDILEESSNEQMFDLIKTLGNRVVFVQNGSSIGSGIIFRARDKFYVQTNRHVINDQSIGIKIRFDFNDDEDPARYIVLDRNQDLIGECLNQDKTIYKISSIPERLQDIPDIGAILVDVKMANRLVQVTGLIEYFKDGLGYVIHIPLPLRQLEISHNYEVIFNNGTRIASTGISECSSDYCSHLHIDQKIIPDETKNLFQTELSWNRLNKPFVVVISHPHGKAKRVSFGKTVSFKKGNDWLSNMKSYNGVIFLCHNAVTCPGSSGGCVLLIGEDTTRDLGYSSWMCMHHGQTDVTLEGMSAIGLVDRQ